MFGEGKSIFLPRRRTARHMFHVKHRDWQNHVRCLRKEKHLHPPPKNTRYMFHVKHSTLISALEKTRLSFSLKHWATFRPMHVSRETYYTAVLQRRKAFFLSPKHWACFLPNVVSRETYYTAILPMEKICFSFSPSLGRCPLPKTVIHRKERVSTEKGHFSTGLHAR